MLASMGLPSIKSLHDVARVGGDLKVTCRGCGHVAIFVVRKVTAYFLARGWNPAWELVPGRFRCGRCGSKRVDCGIAPPVERLIPPKPEPVGSEPSWRQVKEHIRRTRG
jgi:hypothetical protein